MANSRLARVSSLHRSVSLNKLCYFRPSDFVARVPVGAQYCDGTFCVDCFRPTGVYNNLNFLASIIFSAPFKSGTNAHNGSTQYNDAGFTDTSRILAAHSTLRD